MGNEITKFDYNQLDNQTAEFLREKERNMREIVSKAYTELGRELKEARDRLAGNNQYDGVFEKWLEHIGINKTQANRLINRFLLVTNCDEQIAALIEELPVSLTYEIAKPSAESTPAKAQAKAEVLEGKIDTLKAYRERIKQLEKEAEQEKKRAEQAEARAEQLEQNEKILRQQLETERNKQPEVRVETRTEYIEVKDEETEAKLRKYEALFGDISLYEGNARRVTNGDAITYAVFEFSEDVRNFIEKYSHLTYFSRELNGMIDEGKVEYNNAIQAMYNFLNDLERRLNETDAIIING